MPSRQYKTPPIEEALCDFTFAPASEWDLTLPGKLHSEISKEYSGKPRQQNLQTVATGPGPEQPTLALQQQLMRIQFPTEDGTRIVSIGKNNLTISVLRPYEGWQAFKPRIENALKAYRKITSPEAVTRIGLRYINRIVVPGLNQDPSKFFNYNLSDDDVLKMKIVSFLKRFEYATENGEKLLITHALIEPSGPERTDFILDIDTIWDRTPIAFEQVVEITENLHSVEGSAFEAIITDEARKLFDA